MNDLEAVLEKNIHIKTSSNSTPIRFLDLAEHSRAQQKGEDFKIANDLGLLTCHFSALKEGFCNAEMKRFTQQKISVATLFIFLFRFFFGRRWWFIIWTHQVLSLWLSYNLKWQCLRWWQNDKALISGGSLARRESCSQRKLLWKGVGRALCFRFVYLFTGLCLCWFTSREPGAVNLDVNVSPLWGVVSMALCAPTFWGQCLYNIVHSCENCWNQTWCICCGWNTYVHPHSKVKKCIVKTCLLLWIVTVVFEIVT